MKCDGSGWIITDVERVVCPGCDDCGGWCERHHCYGNSCLMDHLEEAEERFVKAVCDGEAPEADDLELLMDLKSHPHGGKDNK